ILREDKFDLLLVQGDTTTTFCGALAGFYRHIPVAHVEAGLRTWDLRQPFPEEMNRVLTTRLTALHLPPTEGSAENLRRDGVPDSHIHVTGNTCIDALLAIKDRIERREVDVPAWDFLHPDKRMILVTGHRRESFGGGFELALTCDVLIAEKSARFCFPELRLGIIPGFGGIPRLRRDVGNAVIRDLLLSGRSVGAKRAHELGLVSQVVGRGEGLEVARALAGQSGKFDPAARRAAKAFIKQLPREELAREKELFVELALRPTLLAALTKFVESTDLRPYLP
ncbi:MAG TPA: UDP-N-acetylglucosamine 2-epimerase, partial [Nannocystaceae bacterium]|nr:UDP-N-acetylglucosamine 2-epimerase [Nannocystaceae bacterium]